MPNIPLKRLKQFKSNSVYVKIFLLMFLLCVILSIVFSVIYSQTVISNAKSYHVETDKIYLNTVTKDAEYIVKNLHQSLIELAYQQDLFSFALSEQYSTTKAHAVMMDMALVSENSPLIESIALYVPNIDCVLVSPYYSYNFDNFYDNQLIYDYCNNITSMHAVESNGKVSNIFFYNGQLVIAQDFPLNGSKRLATLFYYVNLSELSKYLTEQIDNTSAIWIYDCDNEPILINDSIIFDQEDIDNNILTMADDASAKLGEYNVICNISEMTSWKFYYIVKVSSLSPNFTTVALSLLPAILILLLVAFVVSWVFATRAYNPLSSLLFTIEGDSNNDIQNSQQTGSEIDYLEASFLGLTRQKSELNSALYNVSHDVISRLFFDLFAGNQRSEESTKIILTSINSPFKMDALYIVGVIMCSDNHTFNKHSRYLSDLQILLADYDNKNGSASHCLPIGDNMIAVVFSFALDSAPVKIIKSLEKLGGTICVLGKKYDLETDFATGKIYRSILDAGFSYNEAKNTLEDEDSSVKDDVLPKEVATDDINNRVAQIMALLENGDPNGAFTLTERVLTSIFSSDEPFEKMRTSSNRFKSALLDYIVHADYAGLSTITNTLLITDCAPNDSSDPEELFMETKEFCMRMINEVTKILKKQQNHFIVDAKEYIAENYSDVNLSLNSVAEAIGAAPSYVSKLFKNNLGIYFTNYLNLYRINQSLSLLENTNKSIKEIALDVGFGSVQNYIRVFSKEKGMPPGRYRDRLQ